MLTAKKARKRMKTKPKDNRHSVLVKLPPADWVRLERIMKRRNAIKDYPYDKQKILLVALREWMEREES